MFPTHSYTSVIDKQKLIVSSPRLIKRPLFSMQLVFCRVTWSSHLATPSFTDFRLKLPLYVYSPIVVDPASQTFYNPVGGSFYGYV